jgi:uncharacterized membrane protein YdjX (TVP38/TMEM64 family)
MKRVLIVAAVLAATGGLVWLLVREPAVARGFVDASRWMRDRGALGVVVLAAAYNAATIVFVPHSAITLPIGFAYGMLGGLAFGLPVSFAAAAVTFFLGRGVLRHRVEQHYKDSKRLQAIDEAVRHRGLLVVTLIRLAPLLPFAAVNYLLAMTAVSTRDYLAGSALGMIPYTVLYVYLGDAATDLVAVLEGKETSAWDIVALVVGVVAAIVVSLVMQRLAHRALQGKLGKGKLAR